MQLWWALVLLPLSLAARSRDQPRVDIPDQGSVVGRDVVVPRGQRALQFLGLPYAVPPLQELRFAKTRTKPLPSWTDIRNATSFMPACLQDEKQLLKNEVIFSELLKEVFANIKFDEDCLYLNVYVPGDGSPPDEGWPVMVWFHPGKFMTGAAELWDGSVLAVKQKVIVVTASYRINIFGFLALADGASPGNYGLHDQVAVLDWVKAKIGAFGGSPSNVCIFGSGAGGVSAGLHTLSKLSRGKFARAIAMSGNALVPAAVGEERQADDVEVMELARLFACSVTPLASLVECLRHAEAMPLARHAASMSPWLPVVDKPALFTANGTTPFLDKKLKDLIAEEYTNNVDFMAGYTDMEDALKYSSNDDNDLTKGLQPYSFETIITDMVLEDVSNRFNDSCGFDNEFIIDSIKFYYSPHPQSSDPTVLRDKLMDMNTDKYYGAGAFSQAMYFSKSSTTYLYRFDYKPKKNLVPIKDWVRVPHTFDLPFVWGMPYWPNLASIVWNGADKKISDVVMNLWANFARNSNPVQGTLNIKWEPFTAEKPGVMILDRFLNMSDGSNIDYKSFAFWNDYYPQVVRASMSCCNNTNTATRVHQNYNIVKLALFLTEAYFIITR